MYMYFVILGLEFSPRFFPQNFFLHPTGTSSKQTYNFCLPNDDHDLIW